jgi:hypothetical protein
MDQVVVIQDEFQEQLLCWWLRAISERSAAMEDTQHDVSGERTPLLHRKADVEGIASMDDAVKPDPDALLTRWEIAKQESWHLVRLSIPIVRLCLPL